MPLCTPTHTSPVWLRCSVKVHFRHGTFISIVGDVWEFSSCMIFTFFFFFFWFFLLSSCICFFSFVQSMFIYLYFFVSYFSLFHSFSFYKQNTPLFFTSIFPYFFSTLTLLLFFSINFLFETQYILYCYFSHSLLPIPWVWSLSLFSANCLFLFSIIPMNVAPVLLKFSFYSSIFYVLYLLYFHFFFFFILLLLCLVHHSHTCLLHGIPSPTTILAFVSCLVLLSFFCPLWSTFIRSDFALFTL